MPKYDDEFKDVKKGLPAENTPQKSSFNFVLLFAVVGVIFGFLVLLFQDSIFSQGAQLAQTGSNLPEQILINSILALLVGSVQAWVFKGKVKSRIPMFIAFSIVGGLVAGICGGLIIDGGLHSPFIVGLVSGAIAGGLSSSGQNSVMRNSKYGSKWFIYSIFSWSIIFAITWVIGWLPDTGTDMAVASLFLMIASGVGLAVFLNQVPQIEFS